MPEKRSLIPSGAVVPVKKAKTDLVAVEKPTGTPARTSSLDAPIMLLTGHGGEIFCGKFHPGGQLLLSSGFDRQIFIWNVYGECENLGVMTGHTGSIMDMHFSTDGNRLFTVSTDKTVGVWDMEYGTRIKKLKGHTTFVNTCHPSRRGPQLVCSAGDDCSIRLWDTRKRNTAAVFNNTYQVTAVSFNDVSDKIISGGIDNDIKVWDMRNNSVVYKMSGHTDTVTGMSLSPDGSYVLTNSMDNTLRIFDIRPYVTTDRCVKILSGHKHNFEKNLLRCAWSGDGSKVSAGSADRLVYIWDTTTRKVLYQLPGHHGSVNEVTFHPQEPIMVSVSSDKQIYLGEIE